MMRNRQPLVSVVMPVYNAGDFVVEAIESILNQTYKNWELIIVDDASRDESSELIGKYERRAKVKVLRFKKNRGRGGDAAANEGIRLAKGKYIARMDSDDVSLPERLEKQVKFLEENPGVFIVGSSAEVIDGKGKRVGEKLMPESQREIFSEYLTFHPMIHSAVMFRNKQIKRKDFYKLRFSANNDYFTFLDLISRGHRFANLPEKLVKYRIYGDNNSLKKIKRSFWNTIMARLIVVRRSGYPVTFSQVLRSLGQLVLVMALPGKVAYYLYLFTRKIITFKKLVKKMKLRLKPITLALPRVASVFLLKR